jgi:hypothetical protein
MQSSSRSVDAMTRFESMKASYAVISVVLANYFPIGPIALFQKRELISINSAAAA